jgi:hypothetical protein
LRYEPNRLLSMEGSCLWERRRNRGTTGRAYLGGWPGRFAAR